MKHALSRRDNKKNQKPHTNTLETKTIRSKSWRNTLLSMKRTPAIAAIAAGFFIASAGAALASSSNSQASQPVNDSPSAHLPPDQSVAIPSSEETPGLQKEISSSEKKVSDVSSESTTRIEASIENNSSTTAHGKNTESYISVNGKSVEVPAHGTYRETIKDDNGKTTIKIRGNGSGVSIRTEVKNDEEAE